MTHSNPTISPLRQRMIDDMVLRKLSPKTQQTYIRSVIKLAQFLDRSPHTATAEDLRRFQLHLASNGVSSQTINVTITGLRFFFEVTLEDHQILRRMSSVHEPRKLPAPKPRILARGRQICATLSHFLCQFAANIKTTIAS